jgi:DNA-binding transcriptional MerR regulator
LDKAPDAFRTISEVADDLDVPQHVLRFWESRFTQIRPMKRAGGRRYYRADDVDLLRGIRHLLYGQGYTIRGVQRILKEQGARFVQDAWRAGAELPERSPEDEADIDAETSSLEAEDDAAAPAERKRGLLPSLLTRERAASERREPALGDEPAAVPRAAPRDAPSAAGKLPRDDLHKLQAALHELTECRRLLDGVLG